jgi:hypothetical protein
MFRGSCARSERCVVLKIPNVFLAVSPNYVVPKGTLF